MPKILCLHGHGTSAAIFKSQTASFRAKLPPDYVFDFVDAPIPSPPAAGIDAIYKNTPTYTWYPGPTSTGLRDAHGWVAEYARTHGPYDAVCCFSQGCALIATMILFHGLARHDKDNKTVQPLPFRAAIFICGGIPLPALEDIGLDIPAQAHEISQSTGALLNGTAGRLSEFAGNVKSVKRGVGLWDENEGRLLHHPGVRPPREDVFGLDFTSFPPWACISIPTVHVYGAKDPRWPAAIQLAEFCPDRAEFDHGGGHDIPRSTAVSESIAGLVEEVMKKVHSRSS